MRRNARVATLLAGSSYPLTWDPATVVSPFVLSAGNRRLVLPTNNTSNTTHIRSKQSFSSGKVYWEFRVVDLVNGNTGTSGFGFEKASATGYLGSDLNGLGWWPQGGLFRNNVNIAAVPVINDGDLLMFAFDAGIGSLWVGKNGTWAGAGNPAAGTGAQVTGLTTGVQYWIAATPFTSNTETVTLDLIQPSQAAYLPSGFGYVR
jgi:hypothetical protein